MVQHKLKSMTGYGASAFEVDGHRFTVRCRTVNHKALDIRCKLPVELHAFERLIQKLVRERLSRGHVDLAVSFDRSHGQRAGNVNWNGEVADRYRTLWREAIGDSEAVVDPAWLLAQDGVWSMEMAGFSEDALREEALAGVDRALEQVLDTRKEEGDAMMKVLLGRLVVLDAIVGQVKVLVPEVIRLRQEALRNRIEEAGGGGGESSTRLEEELIHLADKMDVDEEVSRLESHLKQFRRHLETPRGPMGKRLTFLVQEMMREATTIASKSGVDTVSGLSVDARVEIERIREQIMNVE